MLDIGMVDFLNPGILSRLRLIYTDCFFFVHAASRAFGPPALMPCPPSTSGRLGYYWVQRSTGDMRLGRKANLKQGSKAVPLHLGQSESGRIS